MAATRALLTRIDWLAAWLAIGLIHLYRAAVAPWLPPVCRFEPSCSRYAEEALRRYGALRGGLRAAWRVLKCQPFHPGGLDPVAPVEEHSAAASGDRPEPRPEGGARTAAERIGSRPGRAGAV